MQSTSISLDRPFHVVLPLVLMLLSGGCGTMTSTAVTDQLLVSDAVDRTVAKLGFHQLAGEKVFLDTQHLTAVKGVGFVNAEYITSSLRQQLVAGGCLLQEKLEEAEYVVEVRVGALGSDGHEITYGLPANNALNAAASLLPNTPGLPTIPEIALAKRNDKLGAAKIAAFAYHRETRRRVWQSGISIAASTKRDVWVLGAGPFQRGSIYDGTRFAGSEFYIPFSDHDDEEGGLVVFNKEKYFGKGLENEEDREGDPVNYETLLPLDEPADEAGPPAPSESDRTDAAEAPKPVEPDEAAKPAEAAPEGPSPAGQSAAGPPRDRPSVATRSGEEEIRSPLLEGDLGRAGVPLTGLSPAKDG